MPRIYHYSKFREDLEFTHIANSVLELMFTEHKQKASGIKDNSILLTLLLQYELVYTFIKGNYASCTFHVASNVDWIKS